MNTLIDTRVSAAHRSRDSRWAGLMSIVMTANTENTTHTEGLVS